MIKKIAIFSTSRADYNYTYHIFKILKKKFKTKLIVTGTHFSKLSNLDYIKKDSKKFNYIFLGKKKTSDRTSEDQINNIFHTNIKIFNFLKKNKTDLVILFGDRYELLGVASICVFLRIPICHFYGGETNCYMNIDTQVRNALTKMSHIHFTSSHFAKKNILFYGEKNKNIFVAGKLKPNINYNDNIKFDIPILNKIIKSDYAIVTFHSINLDKKKTLSEIKSLLNALKKFKKINFIWSGYNSDPENYVIIDQVNKFRKKNRNHIILKQGVGGKQFYHLIKKSKFFIGNSSSIFLDCSALKVPAINVGDRQKGRFHDEGIYSISANKKIITETIYKLLKKKNFNLIDKNIYFDENELLIIKRIKAFLARKKIDQLSKK